MPQSIEEISCTVAIQMSFVCLVLAAVFNSYRQYKTARFTYYIFIIAFIKGSMTNKSVLDK